MTIKRCFLLLLISALLPVMPAGAQSATDMDWEGTLNNKIRFSMCTSLQDIESGLVMGEMQYTKGSGDILLLGSWKGEHLYLKEMLPDGTVSGIMNGTVRDDVFMGEWQAPDKIVQKGDVFSAKEGKAYALQAQYLKQGCETNRVWSFDPDRVAGTYQYSYGKNSAAGTLTVRNEGNGNIAFQIDTSTGAPSFNMARVPDSDTEDGVWAKGHIEGNRLLYEIDENCAFSMTFFRNFVRIQHPDDRVCMGMFGMGAGVAGDFVKLEQ